MINSLVLMVMIIPKLFPHPIKVVKKLKLPFVGSIKAGFPSPANDFLDLSIDLNQELINNKTSTFYARAEGDSMENVGISDGDLLIIDRSIKPQDGKIAICVIDGEFTVKRIKIEKDCCYLIAENSKYKPIKVTFDNEFIVWGIVIHCIKSF